MNKKSVLLRLLLSCSITCALPAAEQFWDPDGSIPGSSVAGNWDTVTTNWSPSSFDVGDNVAWVQANNANFTVASDYTVTLTEPISVGNITLSGTAGTVTISGTLVNNLALVADATLTTGGRNLTISAPITGGFVLTRSGAGTLTLSGANTYSNGTILSGGTTAVGIDSISSGGVITSGPLGTGPVTVSAASTLTAVGGARVVENPVTLNANATISGTNLLTFTNGNWLVAGAARTLTVNNTTNTTIESNLTDDGVARTLTKAGTGKLILSGNNTNYQGQITVSAGTLSPGTPTGVLTSNAISVSAAGTLNLNGFDARVFRLAGAGSVVLGTNTLTAGNDFASGELTGVMSGTGGYVKVGAISQVLSGTNTFTGGITITAGSLYLPTNAVGASPFALGAGNNTITITGTGRIGANRASPSISIVTNNVVLATPTAGLDAASGGDFVLAGQVRGSGGFVRTTQGSGFTVLAASNTFTGGVEIDARPFGMGNKNALGPATFIIGHPTTPPGNSIELGSYNLNLVGSDAITNPVTINQSFAFGTRTDYAAFGLELSGPVSLAARTNTIFVTGTGLFKLSGIIGGSGGINKAGDNTLTLSAANTYTGPTIVSNGPLALIGSGSIASSSDITVLAGATLDISGRTDGTLTVAAPQKLGGSGTIIGSATGGLTMSGGGIYRWQLSAEQDSNTGTPGTDFDQLSVTAGNLVLGGSSTLLIQFANTVPSYTNAFWQSNHTWKIISLSGTAANPGSSNFSAISGNPGASAGTFSTSVDGGGNIILSFVASVPPQPIIERTITGAGTTNATIKWSAVNGTTYEVQYKDNVDDLSWNVLGTVTASGSTASIIDTTDPVPAKRFYRILVN